MIPVEVIRRKVTISGSTDQCTVDSTVYNRITVTCTYHEAVVMSIYYEAGVMRTPHMTVVMRTHHGAVVIRTHHEAEVMRTHHGAAVMPIHHRAVVMCTHLGTVILHTYHGIVVTGRSFDMNKVKASDCSIFYENILNIQISRLNPMTVEVGSFDQSKDPGTASRS